MKFSINKFYQIKTIKMFCVSTNLIFFKLLINNKNVLFFLYCLIVKCNNNYFKKQNFHLIKQKNQSYINFQHNLNNYTIFLLLRVITIKN